MRSPVRACRRTRQRPRRRRRRALRRPGQRKRKTKRQGLVTPPRAAAEAAARRLPLMLLRVHLICPQRSTPCCFPFGSSRPLSTSTSARKCWSPPRALIPTPTLILLPPSRVPAPTPPLPLLPARQADGGTRAGGREGTGSTPGRSPPARSVPPMASVATWPRQPPSPASWGGRGR